MDLRFGKLHCRLSPFRIILLGFLLVILIGALLLALPPASSGGEAVPFGDALFTATSAVCVTGLVVRDTALSWSLFGQTVILILIQIGGMGVITLAVSLTVLSGRKIGLMERSTMQESISAPHLGGIVRLTGFILRTILVIEGIGAALLAAVFVPEFGAAQGLWYAVFHSVSAFCNAGFDLMGVRAPFSSLTEYASNPVVNLTVMGLIVIGGIGFLTWSDICTHRWHLRRYRMQSKVILSMTAALILGGAAYFFFFEFGGEPPARRFWLSLFQSVAPRTAGFNTADLTLLSQTGRLAVILLMLVGGSPGSTAGGMKTTTLAVLLAASRSALLQEEEPRLCRRRIPDAAVRNAVAVLFLYLGLACLGAVILNLGDGVPLLAALLEASSALGTVGLSLGVTPTLGSLSRAVLIFFMFFGRVGGLTLVYAALSARRGLQPKYPQDKITVG